MSAGDAVNTRRTVVAIAIGVALVWLAIMAFRSGYGVGSDIAERENAEEAR